MSLVHPITRTGHFLVSCFLVDLVVLCGLSRPYCLSGIVLSNAHVEVNVQLQEFFFLNSFYSNDETYLLDIDQIMFFLCASSVPSTIYITLCCCCC